MTLLRRQYLCAHATTALRTWLPLLAVALLLPCFAGPVVAAPVLDDDHLVIVELRLDKRLLSPGVLAYRHEDDVLLPLGVLSDLLEFAVDVDPRAGRAQGWYQEETRRFALDLRAGRVTADAGTAPVPAGACAADDDDIYVAASVLGTWWPVDVDAHLNQLMVDLIALEDLPVQKRLRREEARNEVGLSAGRGLRFPVEKTEYKTFTWPLFDLHAEYHGRSGSMEPGVNLQSSGDVGTFSTHLFAAHTGGDRLVEMARLRAGRTDADGGIFGPLGATRFEVGDLYTPASPLVLRGKLGRGLLLGNHALRRPDNFDHTTVEGDGPPGWDVELYANGVLLDFGVVDESGRYLFEDVPVIFGRNELRTVIFGPQGQTREQTRLINVGDAMLPKGEVSWRLFTVEDDRFLTVGDDLLAETVDSGTRTSHLELGYGVGRLMSVDAAMTRQSIDGVERDYTTYGAQTVLRGFHLRGTRAIDRDGGTAWSLAVRGQILRHALTLERQSFDDFVSDDNRPELQRTGETNLRLGGSARWGRRPLAYDLKVQTTDFSERSITRQTLTEARVATSLRNLQLSTRLGHRRSSGPDLSYSRLYADQLASGSWRSILLRGSVRTRFQPDAALESFSASASWSPLRNVRLGLRVLQPLDGDNPATVGASLSLLRDSYHLSLNTHRTKGQDPYLSLALTTSFTKVPETSSMHFQRQRMASGYGATARVFLDRNANGLFDDKDDPLPEVRVAGGAGQRVITTDEDGLAYLGGLPAHRERNITLDLGTIEDPFMLPAKAGATATGHPGGHVVLDFPVTFAGDVEGTIYVQTLTGRQPARGLVLDMTTLSGDHVATTVSEFDGYYIFQEIPPGWYEVRIRPESLSRRRMRETAPVSVGVAAEGGVSAGNDFVLRFNEERRASR